MKTVKQYSPYLLILLPVILFFSFFFRYTVNAPINDDFEILNFINKCIATDSINEKLSLIFAQHNEHRIIYDRLWTIISYKLQDAVNFNTLAFIGNLSLLGVAGIFFVRFRELGKNVSLFFPVTVMLFNLTSWENITFPMAALSNFTIYLFMIASLWFLSRDTQNKKNLYLALLFFYLSLLTLGSGLFLFPISILMLIYKREYKNLAIYGLLSGLAILLYFYGFQKPEHNGNLISNLINIKDVFRFAFAFLGNAFNYFLIFSNNTPDSILCTQIIGGLFFALFGYITITKYYKKSLFIYSLLVLIVLTAFVTAVSRLGFGIETAGASRYRINGIVIVIVLYLWAIDTFPLRRKVTVAATLILAGVYFFCINLMQYEYLEFREKQTYVGILLYNSGNPDHLNCDRHNMNYFRGVIETAKILETYSFPDNRELESFFPMAAREIVPLQPNTKASLNFSIDAVYKVSDSYLLDGWAFLDGIPTKKQKVFIGLNNKNEAATTFYSVKQIKRFDTNSYFKKDNLEDAGFLCRIKESEIKIGENSISIMIEENGRTNIIQTDKKIIK